MKIAYLHGLESSIDPKDPKIIFMNKTFDEVYAPSINYKDNSTFSNLLNDIKKMQPDLIVGSSLGGYVSYLIGSKLSIKTILFNPAMVGRSFDPMVDDASLRSSTHNVYFGKNDKVIDGSAVKKYFNEDGVGSFKYNSYSGGHRIPANVFIDAIKNVLNITEVFNISAKYTMKHIKLFEDFINDVITGYDFVIKELEDNYYIVRAMYKEKSIGELYFIKRRSKPILMAGSLSVDPNHRRKGIASAMYEFAEKELGMKFVKSEDVLTPDGKLLWNNPNRKFGLAEASNKPAKYVLWKLNTRDNKTVDQCSVVFQDKLEYHSQLSNSMEQHHSKLFELKGGRYTRTPLAIELGVMPPSDSYSLTCGLVKKIGDFLSFWQTESYELVYDEPTDNEELFEEYIKKAGLTKFAKERL